MIRPFPWERSHSISWPASRPHENPCVVRAMATESGTHGTQQAPAQARGYRRLGRGFALDGVARGQQRRQGERCGASPLKFIPLVAFDACIDPGLSRDAPGPNAPGTVADSVCPPRYPTDGLVRLRFGCHRPGIPCNAPRRPRGRVLTSRPIQATSVPCATEVGSVRPIGPACVTSTMRSPLGRTHPRQTPDPTRLGNAEEGPAPLPRGWHEMAALPRYR